MTDREKHIRIKRLIYRSWHRGCKETDQILGHFADTHLASLPEEEVSIFEELLEEHDADIWKWLVGHEAPKKKSYLPIIEILREYSEANKHGKAAK